MARPAGLLLLLLLSAAALLCAVALPLAAQAWVVKSPVEQDPPINVLLGNLTLPNAHYKAELFAAGMPYSRSLAQNKAGNILFVGSFNFENPNQPTDVWALTLTPDYKLDKTYTVARNLTIPNGVVFHDGHLYIATNRDVLVLRDIESRLANPPQPEFVMRLVDTSTVTPDPTWHGWRYIRSNHRDPSDRHLYVALGAPCNTPNDPVGGTCACLLVGTPACDKFPACQACRDGKAPGPIQHLSRIVRFDPNAAQPQLETMLTGTRNSLGIDFDANGELWFTENSRDNFDPDHSDRPPDELNHLVSGLASPPSFGYPFCYGIDVVDPEFNLKGNCDGFVPAAQPLGAHVAALGIRFSERVGFESRFRGGAFIAQHGSWNSDTLRGYSIAYVQIDQGKVLSYENFTGMFLYNGQVWGRPVDLEILGDGSLLVSNDRRGEIYRISYTP